MVAAWIAQLSRGVLAATLGITITLALDHSAFFGLVAFGAFAVLSGAVTLIGSLRARYAGRVRTLFLVQGSATVVAGAAALVLPTGGVAFLALLVGGWAIVTGLLEGASGILTRSQEPLSRDWIITGVLTVVLGVVALVLPPDFAQAFAGMSGNAGTLTSSIILVGVIGAWAILVGVLQIISGVTVRSDRPARSAVAS